MRNVHLFLGVALFATSCADGLPSKAPDFSSKRSVEIRIEMGLWGQWPGFGEASAVMDIFGLGRVYVDNNDLGAYSMNQSTTVDVPGNGRELMLRARNMGFGAGNPLSHPVDISGFPAGSRILIRCGPRFPDMDKVHCIASR